MTCTRCQGCMAKDHFLDLMESAESMWLAGAASTAETSLIPCWSGIAVGRKWLRSSQPHECQAKTGSGLKKKSMSSQASWPNQPGCESV